jgi:hypothetical protein
VLLCGAISYTSSLETFEHLRYRELLHAAFGRLGSQTRRREASNERLLAIVHLRALSIGSLCSVSTFEVVRTRRSRRHSTEPLFSSSCQVISSSWEVVPRHAWNAQSVLRPEARCELKSHDWYAKMQKFASCKDDGGADLAPSLGMSRHAWTRASCERVSLQ